jgi:hypothetical protein
MADQKSIGELRLFVVGERSGNPTEWDGSLPWALVIAHDAAEASRLAADASGQPIEIPFRAPTQLLFSSGDGGWA